MTRTSIIACAVALAAAAPAPARADDVAIAEALFQQGKRLAEQGDYAAACPKFEESLRHDRAVGTLWHLARCLEETGALASAWARFREAAGEARKKDEPRREAAALRRAEALEPRLPMLTIEVPEPHRLDGLAVTRAGKPVGPGLWGVAVPVDPGRHAIEARAPGRAPWQGEAVVLEEGARVTVTIPELEPLPPDPVGPVGPTDAGVIGGGSAPAPRWYEDRLGWGLAGGGVALALGGALSFAHAGGLEDDAAAAGDLDRRDELLDDAATYRDTGAVLTVVGAGVVVAGIVRLALVPEPKQLPAPVVGLSGRTLTFGVAGAF